MTACTAAASGAGEPLALASDLLGTLTLSREELITFESGLFGFPECRTFALVSAARAGMYWLQSAEHPALAFLLVDPFPLCEGYEVDLPPADHDDLEAESADEIAVLAIVTLPRARADAPTANLRGPLAINVRARRGKQLALGETEYDLRHPIRLRDEG